MSAPDRAANLQDREAAAWQGERQPDPDASDHQLGQAARIFASAADAVEKHEGPRSGPIYEAKLAKWKEAYQGLRATAAQYPGEPA